MARDFFRECDEAIQRDLDEILLAFRFVSTAFKVSAKSSQIYPNVVGEVELRNLMDEMRENKLAELTIVYQALYVQAWSAFEAFVRSVLVAYLDAFVAKKADFETLDRYGLGKKNIEFTGRVLQHIRENAPRFSVDFFALAKNVSTSTPGSSKVFLNTNVFPLLMTGPSADGLVSALERVGFKLRWDDLARAENIQKALKTRGVRETAHEVQNFLKDAARRRHSIVHKAETREVISATILFDAVTAFKAIANALLGLLKADCESKAQ